MGLPCVPGGDWRAGWQAGRRRSLPRSLWERAGDGPGACVGWTQQRSAPGTAALFRGEGGASHGMVGGVRGLRSLAGLRHFAN